MTRKMRVRPTGGFTLAAGQGHVRPAMSRRGTIGGTITGRTCVARDAAAEVGMNRVDVVALARSLSERDLMMLPLRAHRLATTTQLQRWHYPHGETQVIGNSGTAPRLTQRALRRLARHDLVSKIAPADRRSTEGSDSTVWQLGATGDRLLSTPTPNDADATSNPALPSSPTPWPSPSWLSSWLRPNTSASSTTST